MAEASSIDIRNLSIRCGKCDTYQTLVHFARRDDWNVYSYECENDTCDPAGTRTLVEVPAALDAFARRDPEWHGGKRHAGGQAPTGETDERPEPQVFEYDPFGADES